VWAIEQQILKDILDNKRFNKYIDFACGTGRITSFIEPFVDVSIGIDVSGAMMKEAREKLRKTELLNLDILANDPGQKILEDADLITAFRFVLNAEPDLRAKALTKLSGFLGREGILVFNVHGNRHSIRYIEVAIYNFLKKIYFAITRRQPGIFSFKKQLSVAEVKAYLKGAGLRVDGTLSYAFLPSVFSRLLPLKLWILIESLLVKKKVLWGTHLIFMCSREPKLEHLPR